MRATTLIAVLIGTVSLWGCEESPEPDLSDGGGDSQVDAGVGHDGTAQGDTVPQSDVKIVRDATVADGPPPAVETGNWVLIEGPQPLALGATVTGLREPGKEGYARALVAGGYRWQPNPTGLNTQKSFPTTETWIYDMASRTFEPAGNMKVARAGHTATQLPDGRVLIVGGYGQDDAMLGSTEIFDPTKPAAEAWVAGPPLIGGPRAGHAAVLLKDGRVFVIGSAVEGFEDSLEAFSIPDPTHEPNGRWESLAESLREPRYRASAVVLESGKVLVAGGSTADGIIRSDTVELFDPAKGQFQILGEAEGEDKEPPVLSVPKLRPTLLTYRDRAGKEKVLVVGGSYADEAKDEIIDPAFEVIRPINHPFGAPVGHAATLLNDGRVLVCGGAQDKSDRWRSFVFDPLAVSPTWNAMPNMRIGREDHQLVTLRDGTALAVGGSTGGRAIVDRAELFVPGETPRVEPTAPAVTWQQIASPDPEGEPSLTAVWGTAIDNFWVGATWMLYHWDGTEWTPYELPDDDKPASAYYQDDIIGIYGNNADDDLYALGDAGRVWHYDGEAWSLLRAEQNDEGAALWVSGQDVYIAAKYSIWAHHLGEVDVGTGDPLWKEVYSPSSDISLSHRLYGLAGGQSGTFAAGSNGLFLSFVDDAWVPQSFVTNAEVSDASGDGDPATYFVGGEGLTVRRVGDAFQALDSRVIYDLEAVSVADGKAFAVGDRSGLLLYVSGNETFWQRLELPAAAQVTIEAVWNKGDDVVFVGGHGLVFRGTLPTGQ